jgi:hypothetical protein
MMTYGEVGVEIHVFFTSVLDEGEWSASRLGPFICGEIAPCTHWTGWVGLRAGMSDVDKGKFLTLSELELRHLNITLTETHRKEKQTL